ncbi:MAG: hypothetical protein IPI24_13945 [Ignavibacteria bacterium]|nr:hypothetical protein [Ignavibacteria bacterium]MBK7578502.1 hypothetical protein [Ignavibacteria bacterium]
MNLSLGGTTNRLLSVVDEYDVTISYIVTTYDGVPILKHTIPTPGEFEIGISGSSTQRQSHSAIIHDITSKSGNTCDLSGFDLSRVNVDILAVTVSNATPQSVKDSLRFEVSLIIDYSMHPFPLSTTAQLYHFNTTTGGIIPNVIRPTQANQMLFAWSYANCTPHMPLHQLQILRLYNTKEEYREDPEYCQANVDWNKAQNVYLYSTSPDQALSTKLTLTEGTGWYVWRVRPIGNLHEGGMANDSNYGVWSVAAEQDVAFNNGPGGLAIGSQSGITSGSMFNSSFFYEQFDADKNWRHDRVFVEDRQGGNGIAESITYATTALSPVQTQRRSQATNRVVVQSTILDYQGRPLLNVLPTPKSTTGDDVLSYAPGFALKEAGVPYSAVHFDGVTNFTSPFQMVGAPEDYYKGEELDGRFVPDDQGFPFSRSILTSDPTANEYRSSSPGDILRIRPSADRTTTTTYGTATERELVSIFGCEAPSPKAVQKIITKDPNGVVSYAYQREDGKILATAMSSSTNAASMLDLPFGNEQTIEIRDSLRRGVRVGRDSIYQSYTLTVPKDTLYEFQYAMKLGDYSLSCPEICKTCDYEVTVRVRRQGESSYIYSPDPFIYSGGSCTSQSWQQQAATSLTLTTGTYIMERMMRPWQPSTSEEQLKIDEELQAQRATHAQLVEERIAHYVLGPSVSVDSLTKFRRRTATTPLEVINRERLAEQLLERYKDMRKNRDNTDTTIGCCTLQYPIVNCTTGCEESIDYEAMLIAEANKYSEVRNELNGGSNFTGSTFWKLAWNYGGDHHIQGAGGMINALIVNMRNNGYDCRQLYECWSSVVMTYRQLAFENSGANFQINPVYNLIDAFLECTGTKYCQSAAISETYTGAEWVENAWRFLPSPLATDTTVLQEKAGVLVSGVLIACSGDPTNDRLVDQAYRRLRALYQKVHFPGIKALAFDYAERSEYEPLDTMPGGVEAYMQRLEDSCMRRCGAFRKNYIDALHSMYLKAGYKIAGRPDLVPTLVEGITDSISQFKIHCSALALIEQCRQDCNIAPVTIVNNEITVPDAVQLQRWQMAMTARSFRITMADGENCPAPGEGYSWTHVTHEVPVADLIVNYMNDELRHYQDTIQVDLSRWSIREIINQLAIEYPQISGCISGADSNMSGWWGSIPPNQRNPRDPFSVLVKKGDSRQGFRYVQNANGCFIDYVNPVQQTGNPYDAQNPHPIVQILNDHVYKTFTKDVDTTLIPNGEEMNPTPVDKHYLPNPTANDWGSASHWYRETTVTRPNYNVGPPLVLGDVTGANLAAPTFANQPQAKSAERYWDLQDIPFECIGGQTKTLADIEQLLNIKSYSQKYVHAPENHAAGQAVLIERIAVQPCGDPALIDDDELLALFVEIAYEVRAGTGYWTTYVYPKRPTTSLDKSQAIYYDDGSAFAASTKSIGYALLREIWKGVLKFGQGMEPRLQLRFEGDYFNDEHYVGDMEVTFPCLDFTCPQRSTADSCNIARICAPCGTVQCANLCFRWVLSDTIPVTSYVKPSTCAVEEMQRVIESFESQLNGPCLDEMLRNIEISYYNSCFTPDSVADAFTAERNEQIGHYTLYYYDRSGLLVKTVPPEGVNFLTNSQGRETCPEHDFVTKYAYNTLGQMVKSETPDGGITNYWYNALGMLRFSQNAKQAQANVFSYSHYDDLGRVIEVGERTLASTPDNVLTNSAELLKSSNNGTWLTTTLYSDPSTGTPGPWSSLEQRNLVNRVSETVTDEDGSSATTDDRVITRFSYDEHGNVEWIMQDLPGLDGGSARHGVLIQYDYDLLSGRVAGVRQQRGRFDQLLREFTYDHDGKVTSSKSSLDGIIWDEDARYSYDRVGLLERVELGQDSVQGLDYAYTITGWLKGINLPSLSTQKDPGKDGHYAEGTNRTFARDAFGMMLHYHDNDFVAGTDSPHKNDASDNALRSYPLYNGNIAGWAWNSRVVGGGTTPPPSLGARYQYDILNRIRSDVYYDRPSTAWTQPGGLYWGSEYKYDGNGNIKELRRSDAAGIQFDNLEYTLQTSPKKTNRLRHITDAYTTVATHPNDLETQSADNYEYDQIGNLTKDQGADVTSVFWTPANKIDSIVTATRKIGYTYDAMGNRVRARAWTPSNVHESTTWYLRDAQGQVLSIYKKVGTGAITQTEVPLYGSDRLGMIKPNRAWSNDPVDTIDVVVQRTAGERFYELKDHLGNVRVVITDEVQKPDAEEYLATVASQTDYYPFGMIMESRSQATAGYRYGFNGKENDNDVKGTGNQQDYGFRIYDPRVARFLSVDPLTKDYPSWSPYPFAMNRVIDGVDLDGAEYINADDAMLEVRDGLVRLKLENFSGPVRNFFYQMQNWSPNSIGRDPTVASIHLVGSPEQPLIPRSSQTIHGSKELEIQNRPLRKDGKPDNRHAVNKKQPGPIGTVGVGGSRARASAAMEIVSVVIEAAPGIVVSFDRDELTEQVSESFSLAVRDVSLANAKGMIPKELQNSTGMGDLINFVYSGEISSYANGSHPMVRKVGTEIINKISKVGPIHNLDQVKQADSQSSFPKADATKVDVQVSQPIPKE